ncbi:hypothetical protein BDV95DRAFT_603398 [Massariosphaeria phaeospora]|uniref:Uncharacterized protein n=1 Tax=Massariosphaeria phaeospora TaxID=100035 RepID=A0A7C8ML14_9PLEO|nr:hypothetical protein BDV95DRAFT_603398 [Massariosphaeria phaeospora]
MKITLAGLVVVLLLLAWLQWILWQYNPDLEVPGMDCGNGFVCLPGPPDQPLPHRRSSAFSPACARVTVRPSFALDTLGSPEPSVYTRKY